MHRNRVWSFTSPVFRLNRNRLVDIDGYVPALNLLVWNPSDSAIIETFQSNIDIANPLLIQNNLAPVQFKWDLVAGTLPRGLSLRWKQNNGSIVTWPRNTFNGNSFVANDTLSIFITTGDTTGSFTFVLYNNLDNLVCSTPFSVSVIPA